MKRLITLVTATAALVTVLPASAALQVFACEAEWGALAAELGGPNVAVYTATTALQDVHKIQARPSLIAQYRKADLLVCTGAELEIGWLPLLQRESGNARIQTGQPGYFEAAAFVTLIERPAVIDRALGDIHAAGNPHIALDPRNIARVADALAARLAQLDPPNAAHYAARNRDFQARWQAAIPRWQAAAAPLKGVPVAVHHKNWSYLTAWLGMHKRIDLEPRPGVDPSVAHLAQVLEQARAAPVKMVLYANYQSPRASRWFAERAGVPAVELPLTVGGAPGADDLFGLFDVLIARLNGALK